MSKVLSAEPGTIGNIPLSGLAGAREGSGRAAAAEQWLPPDEHLSSLLNPHSFEAEQYRVLRQIVEEKNAKGGLRVVAVTSAAVGDGKTVTALNLAGALVQAQGARILVVDADLRRPSVPRALGMPEVHDPGLGLVEAITSPSLRLADVVARRKRFNLSVLPAGQPPSAPYEVLKSPRLGELLAEARDAYDYVVVDTAPLVPFPDCRLIEKWVDGFLMVVGAHRTPREVVESAMTVIDPQKLVGLVFNGDESRMVSKYYHSYYAEKAGKGR